jgi:exosortase E/protease (VPEID-CTERM system)
LLGVMAAIECIACFPGVGLIFGHFRFPRIAIVSYAVLLGLGYSKFKAQQEGISFGRIYFGAHLVCIGAVLCSTLIRLRQAGWLLSYAPDFPRSAPGYAWSGVYLLGTILLALACVPPQTWIRTIRSTSPLWLYSLLAGVAAWGMGSPLQSLWDKSSAVQGLVLQGIAFRAVLPVLRLCLSNVVADPAALVLGTTRYSITIAGGCSGIEGLGLILVFNIVWLWYFRRETRIFRALLLIPCALACMWLLNISRLCILIFIGDAGYPEVSDIGFHSAAGWISFTIIALAFSLATQRLSWMRKIPPGVSCAAGPPRSDGAETLPGASAELREDRGESPAIRAYLVPFLAILAAAFVSKAASGNFEWLYALRFFAAFIALWYFWPKLKSLDWSFGWFGPVAGVAVFLVWMAPAWFQHQPAASPLGQALAALSPTARWTWIAFRVAAAVVTVPIAEELAFRGYLARRFISREFDAVSFSSLTLLSICLSSAVFGLEHMKNLMDWQHLLLGTLAGLAFAAALRWRGRMGDAVAAHAVSNLLLAAWVLGFSDWAQW